MKTRFSLILAVIMMLTGIFAFAEADVEAPELIAIPEDAVIYAIGDTVSTDIIEFTLTGFDFVEHLEPTSFAEKDNTKGGSIDPSEGMVFVNPEYTVTNIAEETVMASTDVLFTLVYSEGYPFAMGGDEVCYIVAAPFMGGEYTASSYVYLELPPFTSETYEAYIPADVAVAADEAAPLWLIVSVKAAEGTQEFIFNLRDIPAAE